jgi:uncharacterized protein involved in oxidation of intracellular sulfur
MKILMIVNAPAYGSERMLSALRLATALIAQASERVELSLFMMSDAVTVGLPGQAPSDNRGSLQEMIVELVNRGASIRLCRTCALARGLESVTLYGNDPDRRPDIYGKVGNSGVSIATLSDLAESTLLADKVITF